MVGVLEIPGLRGNIEAVKLVSGIKTISGLGENF